MLHVSLYHFHFDALLAECFHGTFNGFVMFGSDAEGTEVDGGQCAFGVEFVFIHGSDDHTHGRSVVGDGVDEHKRACGFVEAVGIEEEFF